MYEIEYTGSFKKCYKLIQKRGYNMELLAEVFGQLADSGTVKAEYKPHKLYGKYAGYWECHIRPDWLLIWETDEQKQCIVLHYTGTHSDLF